MAPAALQSLSTPAVAGPQSPAKISRPIMRRLPSILPPSTCGPTTGRCISSHFSFRLRQHVKTEQTAGEEKCLHHSGDTGRSVRCANLLVVEKPAARLLGSLYTMCLGRLMKESGHFHCPLPVSAGADLGPGFHRPVDPAACGRRQSLGQASANRGIWQTGL